MIAQSCDRDGSNPTSLCICFAPWLLFFFRGGGGERGGVSWRGGSRSGGSNNDNKRSFCIDPLPLENTNIFLLSVHICKYWWLGHFIYAAGRGRCTLRSVPWEALRWEETEGANWRLKTDQTIRSWGERPLHTLAHSLAPSLFLSPLIPSAQGWNSLVFAANFH